MYINSDVKEVLYFLSINIHFFAAQFIETPSYSLWAERKKNSLDSVTQDMQRVFNNYGKIADYRRALCGNSLSLMTGEMTKMCEFLVNNQDVVEAFKRHLNTPVIEEWYQTQATCSQQINRKEKKKIYEKEIHNEALLNKLWDKFSPQTPCSTIEALFDELEQIDKHSEINHYHCSIIQCLQQYRNQCKLEEDSSEIRFRRPFCFSNPNASNKNLLAIYDHVLSEPWLLQPETQDLEPPYLATILTQA